MVRSSGAPTDLKLSVMIERVLFGAFERLSTVPGSAPIWLVMLSVPVALRDVIFVSAARPPMAVRYFSIVSSADWARTRPIDATTRDRAMTGTRIRIGLAYFS